MTHSEPETVFQPLALSLRDGRRVVLRAVRPDDGSALQAAIRKLSPESRYRRFMAPLHELSENTLERAVNPHHERELQLVAVTNGGQGEQIVGGARYSAAPGSSDCEFAVAVVDDWQGVGLARHLLEALIRAASDRGFGRMEGHVLATNTRMLALARRLGFAPAPGGEDPTVRLVRRDLRDAAHR